MFANLNNSYEILYANTRKDEMNLKQGIVIEDQDEVKKNATMMSHNEDGVMLLQYGIVEHNIVLSDNEENEAVKCDLNLEVVNKEEKLKILINSVLLR